MPFQKNLHIKHGDESEYTILLLLTLIIVITMSGRIPDTMVIPHYAGYPPHNKHMCGTAWRLLMKVWKVVIITSIAMSHE